MRGARNVAVFEYASPEGRQLLARASKRYPTDQVRIRRGLPKMSSTKSPLAHLESLLRDSPSQDLLIRGEIHLEGLHPLQRVNTAARLIQLFTDRGEQQDLLFSILQVLEAATPRVLAASLLHTTPCLVERSRHWPEVFFLRACRSLPQRTALCAKAARLPLPAREEVRHRPTAWRPIYRSSPT